MNSPNTTTTIKKTVPIRPTIASLCLRKPRHISAVWLSCPDFSGLAPGAAAPAVGSVSVTSEACAMKGCSLAEAESDSWIQPGQSHVGDEGADHRQDAHEHDDRPSEIHVLRDRKSVV